MGRIPVFKPKEIAAILIHLGFQEVRQRGSHKSNFDTPMDEVQLFPSIQAGMFLPSCFGKSDFGLTVDEFIKNR